MESATWMIFYGIVEGNVQNQYIKLDDQFPKKNRTNAFSCSQNTSASPIEVSSYFYLSIPITFLDKRRWVFGRLRETNKWCGQTFWVPTTGTTSFCDPCNPDNRNSSLSYDNGKRVPSYIHQWYGTPPDLRVCAN